MDEIRLFTFLPRVPLGRFFTGNTVISQVRSLVFLYGVTVLSVTSDATAYNIQMASLLGIEVDGVDKASFTAYVIIIFQLNYHKRCCGRQSRTVLSYNG